MNQELLHEIQQLKSHFAWFSVNAGSEKHLIDEIRGRFPQWRFAYSRPGMVTFRLPYPMSAEECFFYTPFFAFARRWGVSWEHGSFEHIVEFLKQFKNSGHWQIHFWEQELLGFDDDIMKTLGQFLVQETKATLNQPPSPGPLVHMIRILRDEFWLSIQYFGPSHVGGVGGGPWPESNLNEPIFSPPISRAYHKIKSSWAILSPSERRGHWVELGCSPGGAFQFLGEQQNKVTGIDPGKIDERILNFFVEKNPQSFHFLNVSAQNLNPQSLQSQLGSVDWLAIDMNLSVKQSLSYSEAIIREFSSLKGIIYTFKISHPDMIQQLPGIQMRLKDYGFPYQLSFQWVSHRKEFLQLALKQKNFTTILPKDLSRV